MHALIAGLAFSLGLWGSSARAEAPRGGSIVAPAYQVLEEEGGKVFRARVTAAPFQAPTAVPDSAQAPTPEAKKDPRPKVRLRVTILEKRKSGHLRPRRGLEKNLRVYEDGVEQEIQVESLRDLPMSVAFLFEWRNFFPLQMIGRLVRNNSEYWRFVRELYAIFYSILQQSMDFLQILDNPDDTVAIVAYNDFRKSSCDKYKNPLEKNRCQSEMDRRFRDSWVVPFTRDMELARDALDRMANWIRGGLLPSTEESNFFDTLTTVQERFSDSYRGLKTIVIIGSGIDTFSTQYRDQVRKQLVKSNVQIFTIGTGWALKDWLETFQPGGYPAFGDSIMRIPGGHDFIMGDETLRELAEQTGGWHCRLKTITEMESCFQQMSTISRNQYLVTYVPKNLDAGGASPSPKEIKVKLIELDDQGRPVLDNKNRPKGLKKMKNKKGDEIEILVHAPKNRPSLPEP